MDKLHANLPGARVPLNVFSSWGGVSCHVKLTTTPGFLIRLSVASFLIEPTDCVSDALTVYDALLPMRGRILHRCAASLGLLLLMRARLFQKQPPCFMWARCFLSTLQAV